MKDPTHAHLANPAQSASCLWSVLWVVELTPRLQPPWLLENLPAGFTYRKSPCQASVRLYTHSRSYVSPLPHQLRHNSVCDSQSDAYPRF